MFWVLLLAMKLTVSFYIEVSTHLFFIPHSSLAVLVSNLKCEYIAYISAVS